MQQEGIDSHLVQPHRADEDELTTEEEEESHLHLSSHTGLMKMMSHHSMYFPNK